MEEASTPTLVHVTLLTRARALRDGVPMRAEATFVGLLGLSNSEDFPPVSFTSLESVVSFVEEMTPDRLDVRAESSKEARRLRELLNEMIQLRLIDERTPPQGG
jgi:hypothetical protein